MVLHERPRGPQSALSRSNLDNKENVPQRKVDNWNYGSSSKATLTARQREAAKPLQEVKQAPVAQNAQNSQGNAGCREIQEVNLLKIPTTLRSRTQRLSAVPAKRPNPLVQNIAARQITLPKSYLNSFANKSEHSSKPNATTITTTTSTTTFKKPTRLDKPSTIPTSRNPRPSDVPIAPQKCTSQAAVSSDMSRVDQELHRKENSRLPKAANSNDKTDHISGKDINENQRIGPASTSVAISSRLNVHITQESGRSSRYQRVDAAPAAPAVPAAAAFPSQSNVHIAQERGEPDKRQRADLAHTAALALPQSKVHTAQERRILDRHQSADSIPTVDMVPPQSDVLTAQEKGRPDKRQRDGVVSSAVVAPPRPNIHTAQEKDRSDRHQRVDVTLAAAVTPVRSKIRVRPQRVDITPLPLQSNVHVAQDRGRSDTRQIAENARCVPERDESPCDDYLHNISLMSEYSADIFAHLRQLETLLHPDIGYMDRPSDGDWIIRQVNVDSLVHICYRLGSQSETLHLAVHLFDRTLSKGVSLTEKGVLLAIACLLIAWKFEERCTFHLVYTLASYVDRHEPSVDNGVKALLAAEITVLKLLDFRIGWPGPLPFLRRCSRADGADYFARQASKYILEQILLDPRFLVYKPSLQAAAAMFLSRFMMGRKKWTENMVKYSGYVFEDLGPVIIDMIALLRLPGIPGTNAHRKYSTKPFLKVSPWVTRNIVREEYNLYYR
ncbi:hypothetical protein BGZ80_004496 [Entomortierella chlamydospora]|uniref:Cyclin N-terminal domain-containing protein n=1 Tax=Entomortierella chlamydospora TaxID=101097 RepID=A0A9P6N1I6_9FUNG|nr:hypothetical protein BGZ79_007658 [Entomortierella chlamydospora]KAG0020259.1 hypothetical protein BGZ80_004496 [Entomortierella chlamydospora]